MMYVYILRCKDGSFYTGWTDNLEKRLAAHSSGKGAKYTRGRGPVQLVYAQEAQTKSSALQREAFIKKLTRLKKQELVLLYNKNGGVLPPAE